MSLNNDNTEAWNKITQTHNLFKKITSPLKQHLNIDFGYMIVFNDGHYYQIIEDLNCLKKWVTNVETSHIFCSRNVTTYFDEPYNFTIWPEKPTCPAMEIYKEYGMWNGITVSRQYKNYTELYWFTKQNAKKDWQKWFIRNKSLILEAIQAFVNCKNSLFIPTKPYLELFNFRKTFTFDTSKSEYLECEASLVDKTIYFLKLNSIQIEKAQATLNLSPREMQVLSIVVRGYTAKLIAKELNISVKTVQYHIENIKLKTGLHFKSDIIQLYEKCFYKSCIN